MPLSVLQALLTVTDLAPGATVTLPHGLQSDYRQLTSPSVIWPDRATPIGVTAANATSVTFKNFGGAIESAVFLAQLTHTIQVNDLAVPLFWKGTGGSSGTVPAGITPFLVASDGGAVIDIYVDAATGDDANDGLTPATALQTIPAVYTKFPLAALSGATVTIHLAAGPGDTVADYPVRTVWLGGYENATSTYRYRGPAMVPATLATGSPTPAGTLAATAVGRRTRIDVAPNPGWTVNDLRGAFARITRGADQVFFELPIAENDADSVFVDTTGIAGVLLGTDTLEIVTPGARIVSSAPTLSVSINGNAGYLPTQDYFWVGTDKAQAFERIHLSDFPTAMNVGGLTFDRCVLDNTPFFKGGNCAMINTVLTLGVKLSCMGMEFPIDGRPDSPSSPIDTTVSVEVTSFDIFLVGNPDGPGQYWAHRNVSVYNESNAQRGAIHVVGYGSMFWADDGSFGPAPVALLGAGNAGPFIWCVHGGQARINTTAGGAPYTVGTGTGNPLRVGVGASNPAIAYGAGAGAFEEVAGFNGNFQRFLNGTAAAPLGDGSRIFVAV